MSRILRLKIDVSKIDKSALFKGQKGVYLDAAVIMNDEPDKYGNDGMITQDIGKDRRLQGDRGPILGNGQWVQMQSRPAPQRQAPQQQPPESSFEEGDNIPF